MILYNGLLTYDLFIIDGSEGAGGINLAYKMYILHFKNHHVCLLIEPSSSSPSSPSSKVVTRHGLSSI